MSWLFVDPIDLNSKHRNFIQWAALQREHRETLTGHDEGDVAVAVGVHGHVAALEGGPAITGEP